MSKLLTNFINKNWYFYFKAIQSYLKTHRMITSKTIAVRWFAPFTALYFVFFCVGCLFGMSFIIEAVCKEPSRMDADKFAVGYAVSYPSYRLYFSNTFSSCKNCISHKMFNKAILSKIWLSTTLQGSETPMTFVRLEFLLQHTKSLKERCKNLYKLCGMHGRYLSSTFYEMKRILYQSLLNCFSFQVSPSPGCLKWSLLEKHGTTVFFCHAKKVKDTHK